MKSAIVSSSIGHCTGGSAAIEIATKTGFYVPVAMGLLAAYYAANGNGKRCDFAK